MGSFKYIYKEENNNNELQEQELESKETALQLQVSLHNSHDLNYKNLITRRMKYTPLGFHLKLTKISKSVSKKEKRNWSFSVH